jgi:hypothetical protein
MTPDGFRRIALKLPGVIEGLHQGHLDFRAGLRIFATLGYPDREWGMVKLTAEQQSMLVEAEPEIFRPVPGGWGKRGSTNVRLAAADQATLKSALTMALSNIAPPPLQKTTPKKTQRKRRGNAEENAARENKEQDSALISHRTKFVAPRFAYFLSMHPPDR